MSNEKDDGGRPPLESEPIGEVVIGEGDTGGWTVVRWRGDYKAIVGTKLYASPPAGELASPTEFEKAARLMNETGQGEHLGVSVAGSAQRAVGGERE